MTPGAEVRDRAGNLVYLDSLECVRCFRSLPGLLIRVASGVCVGCECEERLDAE